MKNLFLIAVAVAFVFAGVCARAQNLPVLPPQCDIAGSTKRDEAKRLMQHIAGLVPDFEEKFMHALSTTETYGLWDRMRLKGDESHKR